MVTAKGSAQDAKYYVFEMSVRDRKQPLRQVNKEPLSLEKAKQLARIGAQKGKHDRAVTTNPTSPRGFRIIAQYSAGVGKDVAIMYRRGSGGGKKVEKNPLVPQRMRRRPLKEMDEHEAVRIRAAIRDGEPIGEIRFRDTVPELPMPPEEREALRAKGGKWEPYTGESLVEGTPDLSLQSNVEPAGE
jgi:hypothetical protein